MHGTRLKASAALVVLALLAAFGRALAVDASGPAASPTATPNLVLAHGRYIGTGIAGRKVLGVGFTPEFVIVKSEGATESYGRTSTMTGDLPSG